MKNQQEHFGVPAENIAAAGKWKGKKQKKHYPFHLYVPTRKEVASLPPIELKAILVGWMCHSPLEIIPSRSQIEEVRFVLINRKDAAKLVEVIEMCRNYISYS